MGEQFRNSCRRRGVRFCQSGELWSSCFQNMFWKQTSWERKTLPVGSDCNRLGLIACLLPPHLADRILYQETTLLRYTCGCNRRNKYCTGYIRRVVPGRYQNCCLDWNWRKCQQNAYFDVHSKRDLPRGNTLAQAKEYKKGRTARTWIENMMNSRI